jgi:phosphatidylserine/phosphatidylglycerophosphate/cardiolipin synthase-like enzyme
MKLIVQPDDGLRPLLDAFAEAASSIDLTIFRLDGGEVEQAVCAAAARGVAVRALIAHANGGGTKRLGKLEDRLLAGGVTVARTDGELRRYHDKMLIVDRQRLFVLGFNYTALDVRRSRSFGIVTDHPTLVGEGVKLFEADWTRQPYVAGADTLVVSPESARRLLSAFIAEARERLLIYDPQISDAAIMGLLDERAAAGVEIRVLGGMKGQIPGVRVEQLALQRLHVRAIIRDGRHAVVGSQSLRRAELDRRRELGIIVSDATVIERLVRTFEADWRLTEAAKTPAAGASEECTDGALARATVPESTVAPSCEITWK